MKYETLNFGDEIQSIAAKQFLPRIDRYVDRDHLDKLRSDRKIKLIMNGWFMHKPKNWPPSPDIRPLFVSFHISDHCAKELTSSKSIEYFKKHEPIGCRDYYTLNLLRENGIDAYFSGCLTLTLGMDRKEIPEKSDEILLVDLDKSIIQNMPAQALDKVIVLDHVAIKSDFIRAIYRFIRDGDSFFAKMLKKGRIGLFFLNIGSNILTNNSIKLDNAEKLLDRYARAKLVLTSRLHCALPCLALGTPVVFIHRNLDDPRFKGLIEYCENYSVKEFMDKIPDLKWEQFMPENGNIQKIRENLIELCKKFVNEREY